MCGGGTRRSLKPYVPIVIKILDDIQGAHNKFPDFFRMGTVIDSTHIKL